MNIKFKLGKVSIPVTEEQQVNIDGIEFEVTDYNLMEGLEIVKQVPKAIIELKKAMAQDVFEEENDVDSIVAEALMEAKAMADEAMAQQNDFLKHVMEQDKAEKEEESDGIPPFLKAILEAKAKAEAEAENDGIPPFIKDMLEAKMEAELKKSKEQTKEALSPFGLLSKPIMHPLLGKGHAIKIDKNHPLYKFFKQN